MEGRFPAFHVEAHKIRRFSAIAPKACEGDVAWRVQAAERERDDVLDDACLLITERSEAQVTVIAISLCEKSA